MMVDMDDNVGWMTRSVWMMRSMLMTRSMLMMVIQRCHDANDDDKDNDAYMIMMT